MGAAGHNGDFFAKQRIFLEATGQAVTRVGAAAG
eukprot:COSAG04_NODE_1168_length_7978_cov_4.222998_11_plen_34_part_00